MRSEAAAITIVTPFGGHELPFLGQWMGSLRNLMICSEAVDILWLDNSRSKEFRAALDHQARFLPTPVTISEERLRIADPTVTVPGRPSHEGKEIQTALMWQRARQLVQTEWILCLESDVTPPANAVAVLLDALRHSTAIGAVAGNVPWAPPDLHCLRTMAWRLAWKREEFPPSLPEPGLHAQPVDWWDPLGTWVNEGLEIVDAVHFGCTMMRAETLRRVELGPSWPACSPYGSDQLFCLNLRSIGVQVAIQWDLRCGHWKQLRDGTYGDLWNAIPRA